MTTNSTPKTTKGYSPVCHSGDHDHDDEIRYLHMPGTVSSVEGETKSGEPSNHRAVNPHYRYHRKCMQIGLLELILGHLPSVPGSHALHINPYGRAWSFEYAPLRRSIAPPHPSSFAPLHRATHKFASSAPPQHPTLPKTAHLSLTLALALLPRASNL